MDKITVVYFSASGTTKKVAEMVAKNLRVPLETYDLLQRPQMEKVEIDATVPTIFAVPVYGGRVPQICATMIKKFYGLVLQTSGAVALLQICGRASVIR